jgi:hypothetical protein
MLNPDTDGRVNGASPGSPGNTAGSAEQADAIRPVRIKWMRRFLYRKETLKTTWTLRLVTAAVVLPLAALIVFVWVRSVGRNLVCAQQLHPSDAILVENFDPNYLVFARAAALQRAGMASKVLIPTDAGSDPAHPNLVSAGFVT